MARVSSLVQPSLARPSLIQHSRISFVLIFALVFGMAAPAKAQSQSHNQSGGTQRVTLMDRTLGMPAMSMRIPAGWHFEGEVVRDVACSPGDPFPEFKVTSPDGSVIIQMLTPFFTVYPAAILGNTINLASCGVVAPFAPSGVLLTRYIVPALRHGMQPSAPEPVPDSQELIRSLSSRGNMMINSGDGARVHLAYTAGNGQPMEEWIAALTKYTQFQGMNGGTSQSLVTAVSAPRGRLQEILDGPAKDVDLRPEPAWQQRSQMIAQQQAQGIQQRGEQTRQGIQNDAQAHMQASAAWGANNVAALQAQGAAIRGQAQRSQAAIDNAAAGTANYVGNKVTLYRYRNTQTGEIIQSQSSTLPGTNWVSYP